MTISSVSRSVSRWLPAAAYAAFIWWLSSQPSLGILPPNVSDKLAHGLLFGLFALVLWRSAAGSLRNRPTVRGLILVAACCAIYAAIDEFHQSFVPGRDASPFDALADVAGSALVLAAAWGISAWGSARRERREGPAMAVRWPEGAPTLTLLSKRDCHLCDVAEQVLQEVQTEIPFRYEKVDVAGDEGLVRAYGAEVPVVLMEGRKIFKYKVDPDRLRKRLRRVLEGAQ